MNLFKKAAVFTDLHCGLKSNSSIHNQDCVNFIQWFIEQSHSYNCDICLFLGDFHNNRNSINLLTLNYSLQCLRLLNDAFDRIIMIPGNHDNFYKENRSVNSISWAEHIPNIEILNEFHKEGDCIFVPWMVKDDYKKIHKSSGAYMFGHFELPNFLMNQMVAMPDIGLVKTDDFNKIGHVYSGHFHKRQTQKNITYMGNAFPHNFSDAWDDDRGMMILEWGQDPQYIAWPGAPKYRTIKLSDLVTDPNRYLHANSYVKLTLDTDVSYEEANYLKETLVKEYELRELSLVPIKKDSFSDDLSSSSLTFQSVDSIVMDNIQNIQSEFYDPKLLMEIYRQL
jgi:DNA repair exonuclease SbcCD nuclease subunit